MTYSSNDEPRSSLSSYGPIIGFAPAPNSMSIPGDITPLSHHLPIAISASRRPLFLEDVSLFSRVISKGLDQ